MYIYEYFCPLTGETVTKKDPTQEQVKEILRDGFVPISRELIPLPQRETSLLSLLKEEDDLVGDYNARLESLTFFRGRLEKASNDEIPTLQRAIHQDEYSLKECEKRLAEKRWIIATLLNEYRKAGDEQ